MKILVKIDRKLDEKTEKKGKMQKIEQKSLKNVKNG